jgi:phosphate transport system permease protein
MLRNTRNSVAKYLFAAAGFSAVFFLVGIFIMLLWYGGRSFTAFSITEFLFSPNWNPDPQNIENLNYGISSMIISTLTVSFGAMLVAVPLGICTAAWLAEVAPASVREIFKPVIEILAGIPSVVIGFFGLMVMGPFLASLFGMPSGLNLMNGSILLGIMALPTIISVSEDAIQAVPEEYKQASLALGATRWTTLVSITIPAAFSGIIASVMLGLGRAIGETMTVLMATGNALEIPTSVFSSIRPMTANIAIELGEVPYYTTHFYALFAIGLVLFILTLIVNLTAERITKSIRGHRV